MHRTPEEHRREFAEQGYTIFEAVLTPEEIAQALPIFDALITPETKPPVVTGDEIARRQLNSALYCEPRLSNFGLHPAVWETAERLIGGPVRLTRSPVPTVTFSGAAGGIPGENWTGHVDWQGKPPGDEDHLHIFGIMHFTTVAPNGGGFTLVPGSHYVVEQNLPNPELSRRMFDQNFVDFPGLAEPLEIRATAGDILYYHPFLVHGASDNITARPRRVIHTHYFPLLHPDGTQRADDFTESFHTEHLAAITREQRARVGLPDRQE
jgi:hypothetical protein